MNATIQYAQSQIKRLEKEYNERISNLQDIIKNEQSKCKHSSLKISGYDYKICTCLDCGYSWSE